MSKTVKLSGYLCIQSDYIILVTSEWDNCMDHGGSGGVEWLTRDIEL